MNQVETIYWGLVQAYEDVQAKERALEQSNQLLSDNRKQLQIGTMAPLDVVNAESTVATDKQALISSQSALNYQQQIIKQAIARNLNDPALSAAPVIPTDRVSLDAIPEESQPVEALVQEAFQQRPELEQAVLTLRNDEITLKGARNALLPTLDVYGFYGSSATGRLAEPGLRSTSSQRRSAPCPANRSPTVGYGTGLYAESVQQLGSRQGRGLQPDHSHPQPRGAVGAGALADGVPAGGAAAGAALHADPHAGGERNVCADQRPRPGAGSDGGAGLRAAEPRCRSRRSCTSALQPRPMCCSSSATWPSRRTT